MKPEIHEQMEVMIEAAKHTMSDAIKQEEQFVASVLLAAFGTIAVLEIPDYVSDSTHKEVLAKILGEVVGSGECDISMICCEAWTKSSADRDKMEAMMRAGTSLADIEDKEEAFICAINTIDEHKLVMFPIDRENKTLGKRTEFDAGFREGGSI